MGSDQRPGCLRRRCRYICASQPHPSKVHQSARDLLTRVPRVAGFRPIEEGGAAMSLPPVFLEVQVSTNIKRRFAIMVAVTALVGAAALGLWLFSIHDRAADIDPLSYLGRCFGKRCGIRWLPDGRLGILAVGEPDIVAWVSVPGLILTIRWYRRAPMIRPSTSTTTSTTAGTPTDAPTSTPAARGGGIDSPLALMFAHHMNDGSMFSAFASYSDAGFAAEHDEIPPADARRKHAPARRRGRRRRLER